MRGKVVLGAVGGLLFLWLLEAVIVTDAEEVEEKTARLIELANEGGPEAIDEIMDALADEIDADGVTRNQIRRYLDKNIAEPAGRVRRLRPFIGAAAPQDARARPAEEHHRDQHERDEDRRDDATSDV